MEMETRKIAERLEALRQIVGLTAADMAAAADCGEQEYIEFEKGERDFNFTFLFRCAEKLGVDIAELVTGETPTLSFYNLVRGGEGMPIKRRRGFDYQHMSYLLRDRLAEPFVVTAKYDAAAEKAPIHTSTHEGQEFDYILEGSLKVRLENHIEVLGPGDSIMYDSSHSHGMIATGGKDCRFLAIVIKGDFVDHTKDVAEKLKAPDPAGDLIYKKFAREVTDREGRIQELKFDIPDNFNFAYDVVDELAAKCPDKPAIYWLSNEKKERVFTFSDLSKYSSMTANYFASLGIKKGDKVMLILKRHYQFWFSILALHKIGAVAIPATNQLVTHDIEYRCNRADIKAVVCTADGGVSDCVAQAKSSCEKLDTLIMVGGAKEGWHNFDAEMPAFSDRYARKFGDEGNKKDDVMLMLFSSGTTGYPKAVAHDYTYPLGHIITARWWHNVDPNGIHFTISDTGWGKALWGKLYGQWLCEAAIFCYDFDRFHADDILPLFKKYNITTFCAPPTMFRFFIKEDLSKYDLSSIKHCTIAGEALNPEVYHKFQQLTGIKLMEGFGQTETTLTVGNLLGNEAKPGSMGKPTPQYDIELLDGEGKPVGAGESGEISLSTKNGKPVGMFCGYYGDKEATDRVWHDGYYHTGDVAWRDEDGYLWYIGRTDDLIKSSGYRIGPFEIESVIMELPYVLECAITGVPDEVRGQLVKATIVLTAGTEPSETLKKEIQDYVKKNTAPYKYPRIVEFVTELPKTISGKIRRVDLRGKK